MTISLTSSRTAAIASAVTGALAAVADQSFWAGVLVFVVVALFFARLRSYQWSVFVAEQTAHAEWSQGREAMPREMQDLRTTREAEAAAVSGPSASKKND